MYLEYRQSFIGTTETTSDTVEISNINPKSCVHVFIFCLFFNFSYTFLGLWVVVI